MPQNDRCPPCNRNCSQGDMCPRYQSPTLSEEERNALERRWQIVEALLAFVAIAVVTAAIIDRLTS